MRAAAGAPEIATVRLEAQKLVAKRENHGNGGRDIKGRRVAAQVNSNRIFHVLIGDVFGKADRLFRFNSLNEHHCVSDANDLHHEAVDNHLVVRRRAFQHFLTVLECVR